MLPKKKFNKSPQCAVEESGITHFHDAVTCHSRVLRAAAHPYAVNHIPPKYIHI